MALPLESGATLHGAWVASSTSTWDASRATGDEAEDTLRTLPSHGQEPQLDSAVGRLWPSLWTLRLTTKLKQPAPGLRPPSGDVPECRHVA